MNVEIFEHAVHKLFEFVVFFASNSCSNALGKVIVVDISVYVNQDILDKNLITLIKWVLVIEIACKPKNNAESKNKKEDIVKSYEQAYSKLLSKKPEVEIEVYSDGKYSKTEFMDGRVAMPHENVEQKDDDVAPTDIPDGDEITMDDIPFN